jgi:hypothetical protein
VKTEGQIRHKLAQARFRHLQRETRTGLSQRPENCSHNGVVNGPSVRVRLCLLPTDRGDHLVCDELHGGLDRAQRCPYFECKHSKTSLRDAFVKFLQTADRAQVAERYPDMAALLWALDMDHAVPDAGALDGGSTIRSTPVLDRPIRLAGDSMNPPNHYLWGRSERIPTVWVGPSVLRVSGGA